MASIFAVKTDLITQLDDQTARELIARLCRADMRSQGVSESVVTWGGDQRAADGGVDVRVNCQHLLPAPSYIKHHQTILQVKAERFPPSKIIKEIAPEEKIRKTIQELQDNGGGSYVIASTKDDVSDRYLNERISAMAECLEEHGINSSVSPDFFGSRFIADWLEQYPALVCWLRQAQGNPLAGWQSYGPWAYNEHSTDNEYLLDERAKIYLPGDDKPSPVQDAISDIRDKLREKVAIRIVGLSGVGKTRLVQALFDNRISTSGYQPSEENVVYTDLADSLEPQPKEMIEALKASEADAVVVIDNCGPDTHQRLTELVKQPDSKLRLITIEYDIREDLPEGTHCYRLEGASPEVIKDLLKIRFPVLTTLDIDSITEFSDGNARIAFALASTTENGGEFARLQSAQLFERLFLQKNEPDTELQRCAEAASLLYSFDGADLSDAGEIAILSSYADVSPMTFSRNMTELKRRGLLQQRGKWQAVLPHAIANGLALRMLQSLPVSEFHNKLFTSSSDRVARSFSRRLSFLHESTEAREITELLFAETGRLGNLSGLSNFERQMFSNLAAVDPKSALYALERACELEEFVSIENRDRQYFARTANKIAYDPVLFDLASQILKKFYLSEPENYNNNSCKEMLASLFTCHLSGTHATVDQRVSFVSECISSSDPNENTLGFNLLDLGLKTSFFSGYDFEFGARKRDYGWYPKTGADVQGWFKPWVFLCGKFGSENTAKGKLARAALGEALRGLWARVGLDDELAEIAASFKAIDGWPEGWLGVRRILQYDKSEFDTVRLSQLKALERELAPVDIVSQIKARVLVRGSFIDDLETDDGEDGSDEISASERFHRAEEKAKSLGEDAAEIPGILQELLPDLLIRRNGGNLYQIGYGVGLKHPRPEELFDDAKSILSTLDRSDVSLIWLHGLLYGWNKKDSEAVQRFLNSAIDDSIWAEWFVELQVQAGLDAQACVRLLKFLDEDRCPTWQFSYLAMGRATDPLTVSQILKIANQIAKRPDAGVPTAIDLLSMIVHYTDKKDDEYKIALADGLLEFLYSVNWRAVDGNHNGLDHDLEKVLSFALGATNSESRVVPILDNILSFGGEHIAYSDFRKSAIRPFFEKFPRLALNAVCQPDKEGRYYSAKRLIADEYSERRETALEHVPTEILIEWCNELPEQRYEFAASTCKLFGRGRHDEDVLSLDRTAIELLQAAPDKSKIAIIFIERFYPRSWSGSLANILNAKLPLLSDLNPNNEPDLKPIISEAEAKLMSWIEAERKREESEERGRNESFE